MGSVAYNPPIGSIQSYQLLSGTRNNQWYNFDTGSTFGMLHLSLFCAREAQTDWSKKTGVFTSTISWNLKQPLTNGCFNWMIPNLYIENGCFTKHPFINGCLGVQVGMLHLKPYQALKRSKGPFWEHLRFAFRGCCSPTPPKVFREHLESWNKGRSPISGTIVYI